MHHAEVRSDDLLIVGAMVGASAAWLVLHVSLVWSLAFGPVSTSKGSNAPWGRALSRAAAALFVVPLAPIFGFMQRAWIRSGLWVLTAVGYLVLRMRYG